ncbi:hypothetical protein HON22_04905 [Candidatus Peregrinibacteria bacterium]|jgi:hypothetical protein|nr:hypothetical protein [Candidatus Peregrinibacteria bacterium]
MHEQLSHKKDGTHLPSSLEWAANAFEEDAIGGHEERMKILREMTSQVRGALGLSSEAIQKT